jgi:hypothetical protein
MKLWKVWAVLGVTTAGLVAGLSDCSNSPSSGADAAVGQPPPMPTTTTPVTTKTETFAVQYLFLGEAARPAGNGPPGSTPADPNAWKNYGYNLDGKVTTLTSTDVCTLTQGAPKSNQVDGTNGIDNSFGSVILPIIQSAASLPNPSNTISAAIDKGDFTILLSITGFDDTPAQNSINLGGQLFAGGAYPGTTPPTFDLTTDWPVSSQLLKNPTDPTQSQIQFNSGYVTNGTYVSGSLANGGVTVALSLVFQGVALTLSVDSAVITFDHTSPLSAANGTIAGVINTNDLITGLKAVAGRISTSLCGDAFNGIAQQIMYASDIIVDSNTGAVTNVAGTACNAISIGLGFTGAQIKNPDTIASADGGTTPPDPCSTDAGTDANMVQDTGTDTSTDATGQ